MKIKYQCELCGEMYSDIKKAEKCEREHAQITMYESEIKNYNDESLSLSFNNIFIDELLKEDIPFFIDINGDGIGLTFSDIVELRNNISKIINGYQTLKNYKS